VDVGCADVPGPVSDAGTDPEVASPDPVEVTAPAAVGTRFAEPVGVDEPFGDAGVVAVNPSTLVVAVADGEPVGGTLGTRPPA